MRSLLKEWMKYIFWCYSESHQRSINHFSPTLSKCRSSAEVDGRWRDEEHEHKLSDVSSRKGTGPTMRAPPSRPHLSLITAKGAHLQIPWHWEVTASISESVGDYSSVHSNQYALSRHCINGKDHICGQDNNVDVFTICSPTQTTKGACATLAPAPPKISFASFPWVPIASQTFQETRGKEFLLGPLFIVVTLGAPPQELLPTSRVTLTTFGSPSA